MQVAFPFWPPKESSAPALGASSLTDARICKSPATVFRASAVLGSGHTAWALVNSSLTRSQGMGADFQFKRVN